MATYDNLILGKEAEERFINTLNINNISSYKADLLEDRKNHIDLYLEINNKKYSCDVKTARNFNDIHHITIYSKDYYTNKLVNGCLLSNCYFFAFETETGFVLFKREDLYKFVDKLHNLNDILKYHIQSDYEHEELYQIRQVDMNREGSMPRIVVNISVCDLMKKIKYIFLKK